MTDFVLSSGGFSPLGALIFTPPTYSETIKIIVKTGMTSVPFIAGDKYQYNATSGEVWPKPEPPPGFTPLFMQELGRYIDWWNKNFYLYNIAVDYRVSHSQLDPGTWADSLLAWNSGRVDSNNSRVAGSKQVQSASSTVHSSYGFVWIW